MASRFNPLINVHSEFAPKKTKTGFKSVDYAKLVVPLLEVTKKQQFEISELKESLQLLQADLEALK